MKKRKLLHLLVMLLTTVLIIMAVTGCSRNRPEESYTLDEKTYPRDLIITHEMGFQTQQIVADWPWYHTAEELVNACSHIYTGQISDISFEIIDYKTGKPDRDPTSESRNRMIHTIYTISLISNYKGNSPSELSICKIGGLYGYKEKEQNELLRSSRLISENSDSERTIVICDDTSLAIGNEYLFCTYRFADGYDQIINPYQFAHRLDSENAKIIIDYINHGYAEWGNQTVRLTDIKQISVGMTFDEVVSVLGEPVRTIDSNTLIKEWKVEQNHQLTIEFRPKPETVDYGDLNVYTMMVESPHGVVYSTFPFDKRDRKTWFDCFGDRVIEDEDVEKIREGMSFEEIVSIIGKPTKDIGSGAFVMEWDMESNKTLTITFNPAIDSESEGDLIAYRISVRG